MTALPSLLAACTSVDWPMSATMVAAGASVVSAVVATATLVRGESHRKETLALRAADVRVDAARRLLSAARTAAGAAHNAIPGLPDLWPGQALGALSEALELDRVLLPPELHARASGVVATCHILLDAVIQPIANADEIRRQLRDHMDAVVEQVHAIERQALDPKALIKPASAASRRRSPVLGRAPGL